MLRKCPGPKNCKVRKCGTDKCPINKKTLLDKIKEIFKKRA